MDRLILDQLLTRLDTDFPEADVLRADETDQWEAGAVEELEQLGLLRPLTPATAVFCDACMDGHVVEIEFAAPDRAYIRCEEHGLMPLDLQRARLWQVSLAGFAVCLAKSPLSPREILPQRLYQIWFGDGASAVPTFLARGLRWADGEFIAREARSIAGSDAMTILVPTVGPDTLVIDCWIRPIQGSLAFLDGSLALDLPAVTPPTPGLAAGVRSERKPRTSSDKSSGRRPGRRRLEDDAAARTLFENGERLRIDHPGMTREQVASRLNLPPSTYRRYVSRFQPRPER